jgi:hypothetical protein
VTSFCRPALEALNAGKPLLHSSRRNTWRMTGLTAQTCEESSPEANGRACTNDLRYQNCYPGQKPTPFRLASALRYCRQSTSHH